jgi:hypothetical protein
MQVADFFEDEHGIRVCIEELATRLSQTTVQTEYRPLEFQCSFDQVSRSEARDCAHGANGVFGPKPRVPCFTLRGRCNPFTVLLQSEW